MALSRELSYIVVVVVFGHVQKISTLKCSERATEAKKRVQGKIENLFLTTFEL